MHNKGGMNMNYKELSKSNYDRRYTEIDGIEKSDVTVVGKPLKTLKENWIIVLAIFAVVMGALISVFELKVFLACIGLLLLFICLFVYGNAYKVTCGKDKLMLKQGFQKYDIKYNEIKNVFISRTSRTSFFIKTYVLVIRCEDIHSFLREFELPLLCVDASEAEKFVNNFKLIGESNDKYVTYERRKSLRRLIENVATGVFLAIILWVMFSTGVIKLF